jgi:hypothetical protein
MLKTALNLPTTPNVIVLARTNDGKLIFAFVGTDPNQQAQQVLQLPAATLQRDVGATAVAQHNAAPAGNAPAPDSSTPIGMVVGIAVAAAVALLLLVIVVVKRKAILHGPPERTMLSGRELSGRGLEYQNMGNTVN